MIDAIASTAGLTPLGLLTVMERTLWTLAALAPLGIGLSKLVGESMRARRRRVVKVATLRRSEPKAA